MSIIGGGDDLISIRSGITNSFIDSHFISRMNVSYRIICEWYNKQNKLKLFICLYFFLFFLLNLYIVKQHLLSYSIEIPHWVQILFWFFENWMAIIVYRRLLIFFKAKDVWAGVNHSHISYLTKPRKLALKTN